MTVLNRYIRDLRDWIKTLNTPDGSSPFDVIIDAINEEATEPKISDAMRLARIKISLDNFFHGERLGETGTSLEKFYYMIPKRLAPGPQGRFRKLMQMVDEAKRMHEASLGLMSLNKYV